MTEIRFYHLTGQPLLQALPALVSKAYGNGHRIVLRAPENEIASISEALWTFKAESFLPHGAKKDGKPHLQPIWLTDLAENPNAADVLILTHNIEQDIDVSFTLCCDIFDGRIDEDVMAARTRWKSYKDKGHNVTYWQQTPAGGWEKKA